jgi:hypothetical protein
MAAVRQCPGCFSWNRTQAQVNWRTGLRQRLSPDNLGWVGKTRSFKAGAVLRQGNSHLLRCGSSKIYELVRVSGGSGQRAGRLQISEIHRQQRRGDSSLRRRVCLGCGYRQAGCRHEIWPTRPRHIPLDCRLSASGWQMADGARTRLYSPTMIKRFASIRLGEEIRAHGEAHHDYKYPYPGLWQLLRVLCSEITAYNRAQSGDDALRPIHRTLNNE